MEDPRLSRMYASHLTRELAKSRARVAKRMRNQRGLISVLLVVLVVAGLAAGYVAHIHGRFSRLKSELKAARNPVQVLSPMPGGQEAVVLERSLLIGGSTPEFLSATILPGKGMDILQIHAYVPGRGEVDLLASPSLEEATKLLDGDDPRAWQIGGPVAAPWAGWIPGVRTADGTKITAEWRGRPLVLPRTGLRDGTDIAMGGLLLGLSGQKVANNTMPDGGAVQAVFDAGNFGGRWPSTTQITADVQLSSRDFEFKVVAMNTGQEPEPMGIGWSPHFVIPSGNRETTRLRLPVAEREEMRGGRATGRLVEVEGTEADYTARGGRALGKATLAETFVRLRPGFLDSGPVVELRDMDSGIGLRLTAMTPLIHAIGVEAEQGARVVTIRPQMNYDDPLSRVWSRDEETGMVVLAPGQMVQWKVRLELFALAQSEPQL